MEEIPTIENTVPIDAEMPAIASMPEVAFPAIKEQAPQRQIASESFGQEPIPTIENTFPIAEEPIPTIENTTSLELTPTEELMGIGTAFAKGVFSRPVVSLAQQMLGVDLKEAQRIESGLGAKATAAEAFGLITPAVVSLGGSLAARAGLTGIASAAAKVAATPFTQGGVLALAGRKATEIAAKKGLQSAAVKVSLDLGVQGTIYAAADEVAKAIEQRPNTINQAAWNVGASGLLAVVTGGALGKASSLWSAKYGPKLSQFRKDFIGRMRNIENGAVPTATQAADELANIVATGDEVTSRLASARGLKRQEIEKFLPKETTEQMIAASDAALKNADDILALAKTDPILSTSPQQKIKGLEAAATQLAGEVAVPGITPFERWTSLNKYKQTLDKLKIWETGQTEAVSAVRKARTHVKKILEDTATWGAAGKRQAEINKAVSVWDKKLKAARNNFMNRVPGTRNTYVANPDKLVTIINQAKKGKGAIKQNALSDFLDATDDLYKTIEKSNANLGIQADIDLPSLTAARAITEKLTPGMKSADFIFGHAADAAAEVIGMRTGYSLGKATGLPFGGELGALFGHYQIKPIVRTILPIVSKPMVAIGSRAPSIHAASKAITEVVNGSNVSKLAANALFRTEKPIPVGMVASDAALEKLDRRIQQLSQNPEELLELNSDLDEILPELGGSLTQTAANMVGYINSQRPAPKLESVFQKEMPVPFLQQNQYKRLLRLAYNPLEIYRMIKDGTITSKDAIHFQNMYPDLHADAKERIMDNILELKNKNINVPYKLRKSLSVFVGFPLDPNLTPQAIQAAQSTYAPKNLPPPQTPQFAPKSGRKSQVPSLTETEQQRRQRQD